MGNKVVSNRLKFLVFAFLFFSVGSFVLLSLRSLNFRVGPVWTIRIPASRGKILDAQGRLCAYDEFINVAYLDIDYLRSAKLDRLVPHLELLLRNFNVGKTSRDVLSSKQRRSSD